MQALPQKTTDYIAEQFRAYYTRKAQPHGMNLKEARDIVDYLSVSGPAPAPTDSGAIDTTKPNVTGSSGRPRPSPERIEEILSKYAPSETEALWNEVFEELIKQYKSADNKKALRFIELVFEKQLKREDACELMQNTSTKTYNTYRLAILTAACILAIKKGLDLV